MACECGECPTDICHGWGNLENSLDTQSEREKFNSLKIGDMYDYNGEVTVMTASYYYGVLGNKYE